MTLLPHSDTTQLLPGENHAGIDSRARFRGCLVGGAIGDALGAPVEFMDLARIRRQFGARGIGDYVPAYGKIGAITDDTQMTLFTAEGLLRAHVRGVDPELAELVAATDHAYLRWLETQDYSSPIDIQRDGRLWALNELHQSRAPGKTCLSALLAKRHFGEPASNSSKGCGGVMRVAPVGLFAARTSAQSGASEKAFSLAVVLAGLTHGHPSGQLPAGVLAALVLRLVHGEPLQEAVGHAKKILATYADHEETLVAIEAAERLAANGSAPSAEDIETLGGGWVAEEALAIGLYCALVATSVDDGLRLAVNHSGDADSTGSIAGNLLGAQWGLDAFPERWLTPLELKDVIVQVADDLHDCAAGSADSTVVT